MALYGSSVEYSLHCLLLLIDGMGQSKASSLDLAEFQGLSPTYVAKLFTQLKDAGLVNAIEGANGGYVLSRPANQITVLDVVNALEGEKPMFQCRDVRFQCAVFGEEPPVWATKGLCSIHAVMLQAEQRMRQTLGEHTLADLAQRVVRKAPKSFSMEVQGWFSSRKQPRAETSRDAMGKAEGKNRKLPGCRS